ncbi:hypothetical protein H2200_008747 [Cladophialophora chaetospira]|uniref:Zn(2)-C6 fungal-type domain-containing protein n=1 Tax=Cladophialophora chaetospira TaxID=386627 RepID=A0AA38X4N7_9EURO|nr:hypothetical protein H2200_008747 [Cladophialophora chaetospira]
MERLPASSTSFTTPTKRKRSTQACVNCRTAKRRCDSARPSCSSCANSSVSRVCVYDDPQEAKGKQSKLIERLQQRINDLERADEGRKPTSSDGSGEVQTPLGPGSQHANANDFGLPILADQNFPGGHFNLVSSPIAPMAATQQINGLDVHPRGESNSIGRELSTQPESTSASHAQAPRRCSATVTVEDSSIYLDQEKDLPPNDEIGVVEPRFGYFGGSSAVTFMSQVRSVLDNADDWADHYETEPASPTQLAREPTGGLPGVSREKRLHASSRRSADLELYALPSREHADALVEVFFTWVHCLYPYLDRPDFDQKYEKIWLGSKSSDGLAHPAASTSKHLNPYGGSSASAELTDKKTFYCTLNIVFALSCQFDPALSPGESRSSDVFWQRAKTLIEQDFNIFNEGNVSLIQALLLFGVYMQSTELSGGCWIVANVATSVAQINGLHQINQGMFNSSLNEKELDLRRRVWSGCILLDRSLSMIYGRPSIMTSRAMIGDDFSAATDSRQPPVGKSGGTLSYSDFFYHHSTLHDILGAILTEFYEKPATGNENTAIPQTSAKGSNANTFRAPVFIRKVNEGDFQSLLRFDTALLRWKSQLPARLKVSTADDDVNLSSVEPSSSSGREIAQLQASVLHARFLHIRILLFRPLLLRALADFRKQSHDESAVEEKSTLHEMLLMQSSVLCISAAQELSKMITKNLQRENTRLPEWWHIIFYLYTCATVMLASRCCTPLREKIGETALQACWAECLNGLRAYQRCSRSARRCCRLLEIFDQRTKNGQYCKKPLVIEGTSGDADDHYFLPSVSRQTSDPEHASSSLGDDRYANTRMADTVRDLHSITHAPSATEPPNPWPFEDFQASESVNSLDAYFNSWTPNSTDLAFLAAIPFDSGLYPQ